MKNLIILLAFLFTFSACEKEECDNYNGKTLIFGHFFGECVGEGCIETFLLTDTELFEDTLDDYNYKGNFSFEKLDKADFDKAKNLFNAIPQEFLKDTQSVYGCPDCADGGGLYVKYIDGDFVRECRIDLGLVIENDPLWLSPFIKKIQNTIAEINN